MFVYEFRRRKAQVKPKEKDDISLCEAAASVGDQDGHEPSRKSWSFSDRLTQWSSLYVRVEAGQVFTLDVFKVFHDVILSRFETFH